MPLMVYCVLVKAFYFSENGCSEAPSGRTSMNTEEDRKFPDKVCTAKLPQSLSVTAFRFPVAEELGVVPPRFSDQKTN
jgi:hypothetical protein